MAEQNGRRKPPAFQWYPGDFKREPGLQLCTFYVQSIWRAMLDLMHFGEPYGHFTDATGIPITVEEFARSINEPRPRVRDAVAHLEQRNVFSRTAAGVIYSRRMVRDERIRQARASGGYLGGNPQLIGKDNPKDSGKVDDKVNLPPTPSSLASSSSSVLAGTDEQKTEKENPTIVGQKKSDSKPKSRGTQLPADWKPSSEHRLLAVKCAADCDMQAEHFRDWAIAKGQVFRDWDAAFRNWLRNSKKFTSSKPPAGSEAARHHSETPGRGRNGSSSLQPVGDVARGTLSPNGERRWSGERWEPV